MKHPHAMTHAIIFFASFKHERARTNKSVNYRSESKDLMTILMANGHPSPDHYDNMRDGISHPKNSRTTYRMLLWHVDATPCFLVERRLPTLQPRLDRVERPVVSSAILHDQELEITL
jgi:hypothetical protein